MVARILIVIVVVAVLGFFGTRGSEKVVKEVTERQEVVDQLTKQLEEMKQLTQQQAELQRAASNAASQMASDSARQMAQLAGRVAELERLEGERRAQQLAAAIPTVAVEFITPADLRIYLDGQQIGQGSQLGEDAPRLTQGSHELVTITGNNVNTRYVLVVGPKGAGKVVLTKAVPTTSGSARIRKVK